MPTALSNLFPCVFSLLSLLLLFPNRLLCFLSFRECVHVTQQQLFSKNIEIHVSMFYLFILFLLCSVCSFSSGRHSKIERISNWWRCNGNLKLFNCFFFVSFYFCCCCSVVSVKRVHLSLLLANGIFALFCVCWFFFRWATPAFCVLCTLVPLYNLVHCLIRFSQTQTLDDENVEKKI